MRPLPLLDHRALCVLLRKGDSVAVKQVKLRMLLLILHSMDASDVFGELRHVTEHYPLQHKNSHRKGMNRAIILQQCVSCGIPSNATAAHDVVGVSWPHL
jgi:hypothetical protein